MYNLRKKITIIVIAIALIFLNTAIVHAAEENNTNTNVYQQESTAKTLIDIKDEQLKTLEDYKAKYGSDTYGTAAYILHIVQVYSIPIGLVGVAICGIYQYVIGLKRLDIRDKGFNTMIAVITIMIICQILPLIFAVVVKSTD